MTTGEILRQLRGNKTIAEVAEQIGIPESNLGMYERDKRIPRDKVKIKIAEYYGRTVQYIFYRPKTTQGDV